MRVKPKQAQVEWELMVASRKLWVFPLLVVVVILGSIIAVVIPQTRGIFEDKDNLAKESDRLDRLVEKRGLLTSLSETDLDNQLNLVKTVLPVTKPVYLVAESLGQELNQAQLRLIEYSLTGGKLGSASATTEEKTIPGNLAWLPVTFTATGPVEGVVAFMQRLGSMAPLTQIRSISISGPISGFFESVITAFEIVNVDQIELMPNTSTDASIEVELWVYYSLPPVIEGKPSDPLSRLSASQEGVLQKVGTLVPYALPTITVSEEQVDYQREDPFSY